MKLSVCQRFAVLLKGAVVVGLAVVLCVLFLYSCGSGSSVVSDGGDGGGGNTGDTTEATILNVLSASSTEIETTGTTGIDPSSPFEIEFSKTMDDASVTTAGNVTFVCGELTAVIHVTKSGSAENTYDMAVDDAWKYGKMDCVLTITTNVKTASGVPLSAAKTYAFQNACSVSDDFNVKTISTSGSCWNVDTGEGRIIATWDEMSAFASFNAGDSSLDVDFTGRQENSIGFSKTVNVSSDFEIELYVVSTTNMIKDADENSGPPAVRVFLDNLRGTPPASYWISVTGGGGPSCYITGVDRTTTPSTTSGYLAICDQATGYYVKLAKSGNTFLRQYKAEGGEYADLSDGPGPEWSDLNISGENLTIGIAIGSKITGSPETASIGYIKLTGITSPGQY